MCCLKVCTRVREFIRHTEQHRDGVPSKMTYLSQRRDELRQHAAKELAERRSLSGAERGGKRRRVEETAASGAQSGEFGTVEGTTSVQYLNGIDHQVPIIEGFASALPDMRPIALTTTQDLMASVASGFADMPDPFHPGPLDSFSAPVHNLLNFPRTWRFRSDINSGAYQQ